MTTIDTGNLPLTALIRGECIPGVAVGGTQWMGQTDFQQLSQITRDPEDLQPTAKRLGYDAVELELEAEIHQQMQRLMDKAKRDNAVVYAQYVEDLVMGERPGVLPPMHLWTTEKLEVFELGHNQLLSVPSGTRFMALDGETQLISHYKLRRNASAAVRRAHANFQLGVVIHHDVPLTIARQYFYDLNILGVRPNTDVALRMNTQDPLNQILTEVETAVPELTGKVASTTRQLHPKDPHLIRFGTLRQMIATVAKGISAVQYGSRPVPLDGVDLQRLSEVSQQWLSAYFRTFAAQLPHRERFVVAATPVLVAVGAIGHQLYVAEPSQRPLLEAQLLADLQRIDWTKGEQWAGIAGKFTPAGNLSIAGSKELGHATYRALSDPNSPGWRRIRGLAEQGQ